MNVVSSRWTNVSLSTRPAIQPDPSFQVPLPVLQTAVEAPGNDTVLTPLTWEGNRATFSFMVFLHFADSQNARLRQFNIYFNGDQLGSSSFSPSSLVASCVYSSSAIRAADGRYNITLVSTAKSVLPPMVNAIEIYIPISRNSPTTFFKDSESLLFIFSPPLLFLFLLYSLRSEN